MSEENQPLMSEAQDNDVSMEAPSTDSAAAAAAAAEPESEPAAAPEPSPRDKALEAFKKKLIDHREYDNKLKNCMYFLVAQVRIILTFQCVWIFVDWTKSSTRRRMI